MQTEEAEHIRLQKQLQGVSLDTEILDKLVVEHLKGKVIYSHGLVLCGIFSPGTGCSPN